MLVLWLALLALLARSGCAEKAWTEWYWSKFDPDAGGEAQDNCCLNRRAAGCAAPFSVSVQRCLFDLACSGSYHF